MPPQNIIILATVLGLIFSDDLSANEQNALGNFIMLIGQVLETSAAQLQLLESQKIAIT